MVYFNTVAVNFSQATFATGVNSICKISLPFSWLCGYYQSLSRDRRSSTLNLSLLFTAFQCLLITSPENTKETSKTGHYTKTRNEPCFKVVPLDFKSSLTLKSGKLSVFPFFRFWFKTKNWPVFLFLAFKRKMDYNFVTFLLVIFSPEHTPRATCYSSMLARVTW